MWAGQRTRKGVVYKSRHCLFLVRFGIKMELSRCRGSRSRWLCRSYGSSKPQADTALIIALVPLNIFTDRETIGLSSVGLQPCEVKRQKQCREEITALPYIRSPTYYTATFCIAPRVTQHCINSFTFSTWSCDTDLGCAHYKRHLSIVRLLLSTTTTTLHQS